MSNRRPPNLAVCFIFSNVPEGESRADDSEKFGLPEIPCNSSMFKCYSVENTESVAEMRADNDR